MNRKEGKEGRNELLTEVQGNTNISPNQMGKQFRT